LIAFYPTLALLFYHTVFCTIRFSYLLVERDLSVLLTLLCRAVSLSLHRSLAQEVFKPTSFILSFSRSVSIQICIKCLPNCNSYPSAPPVLGDEVYTTSHVEEVETSGYTSNLRCVVTGIFFRVSAISAGSIVAKMMASFSSASTSFSPMGSTTIE